MNEIMPVFLTGLYVSLGLILYFTPSIIAICSGRNNGLAIFILNLLLGWTGIGWVIALIWSVYE